LARLLLGVVLAFFIAVQGRAQAPTREVRFLVPFAPGGTADIVGRLLANALPTLVGQRVVVENRTGASGFIAAEAASRAAPDGHTLLLSNLNMLAIAPEIPGMNLAIVPERDLAPIVNVVRVPFILVANPRAPFGTPGELIDYARANPGRLVYASSGAGGGPHLAAELFRAQAGVEMLHVPYRGGTPAVNDIVAGNAHMIFGLLPELLGQFQGGALKPVAMLSRNPHPMAPGVPLMRDTLPDYDIDYWYSVSGPATMPAPVAQYWNRAINAALATPELRTRLETQALEPIGGSIDGFRATIAADRTKWGVVVRAAGIRVE